MQKQSQKKQKLSFKLRERVVVIAGREKGKIGIIKGIDRKTSKLIVEGINLKVKHLKAKQPQENGEIRRIEGPIHSSNLAIYKE